MTHCSRPVSVSIVLEERDPLSAAEPVRWAVDRLRTALTDRGLTVVTPGRLAEADGNPIVLVAGRQSPAAQAALGAAGVSLPDVPEALALLPAVMDGRRVVLACGADARGLVYAVLGLADRVSCASDPMDSLRQLLHEVPVVEQPANRIRSIMRVFSSDVEALVWYHDRDFWTGYLTELAAQRFNRFQLAFGIGYDFARRMRDSYFYFAYPFLLSIPGYQRCRF